jgi:MYXO-CTERM domain-containing protein
MIRSVSVVLAASVAASVFSTAALGQYATNVVSYTPGTGTNPAYLDPTRSLGEPSRFTPGSFPGAVTPFQSAFLGSQLTQVGRGGSLVVSFDTPITNSASNPFGIDFLVFGNAFLPDANYPSGITSGTIAAEGGDIDVSADGTTWFRVATNAADGLYPTLGYSDLTNPYSTVAGLVNSNFQQPVNPAFTIGAGLTFADIVAGYNGSGGGFGVDIASSGLSVVNFVRISVASNAQFVPEIDGFAVVPAPGAAALLGLGGLLAVRRRR